MRVKVIPISVAEILCPENIPNGRVHRSCSRRTRSGCSEFDCDSGYTIIVYPPSYRPIDYLCNTTGHWRWPKDTGPPCVSKVLTLNDKKVL